MRRIHRILGLETGLNGTVALTEASVVAALLGLKAGASARAGTNGDGLLDNETVLHELANIEAGVRHGNLLGLRGGPAKCGAHRT
eukprot:EC833929.1.p3 GENE.EC833929.1~~EC833929.1.p3  ORF type:complete len:85 (-),score=7.02 EC833929.1:55-309(-)